MPDAPIRGQGVTVSQLFHDRTFRLEYYQREYSWGRDDVAALLGDLHRHFATYWKPTEEREHATAYPPYFLGSIVYYDDGDDTYLVDGQQRLTTLVLLLIHLKRLADELDLRSETRRLDHLIYSHRGDSFRLDIADLTGAIAALVDGAPYQAGPDATASVRNLLARFADLVEDFPSELAGDALSPFIAWLLDRVCLVEVRADGRDQAWEIFETINDRGQRPGPVDLLKSHILTSAEFERDELNEMWRRTLSALSTVDPRAPSDFVKALLVAKYAATRADTAGIDAAFHEWVLGNAAERMGLTRASDYRQFVRDDLVTFGRRYAVLRIAALRWSERIPAVRYNEYNRLPHHLTAVLAAWRASDLEDDAYTKAQLVSAYLDLLYVRRLVNGTGTAADLEAEVLALVPGLRSCVDVEAVERLLSDAAAALDDDFTGMDTFGLRPDNRAAVRYLLGRITAFVDTECGRPSLAAEFLAPERPYDVEHIWADKFERFQGEVSTTATFTSWRNRLGALLLLPRSDNASFGADPYVEKVEHYQRANLLAASLHPNCYRRNPGFSRFLRRAGLVDAFRAYDDFGVDAIRERQVLYRRICELIWAPGSIGLSVPTAALPRQRRPARTRARYGVKVRHLVEAGAIAPGARLVGAQRGVEFRATITPNGMIQLETGETFTDPSPAGAFVLNAKACSGWDFWSVVAGRRRRSLKDIRNDALKKGLLEPSG